MWKYSISAIGGLVINNDSNKLMCRYHPDFWTCWEYYPESGEYLRWESDGNYTFYRYTVIVEPNYWYEVKLSKK